MSSQAELQEILRGAMQTAFVRFIRAAGGQVQVKLGEIEEAPFDFRVHGDTAHFIAREVPKPKTSSIVIAGEAALDRLNGRVMRD